MSAFERLKQLKGKGVKNKYDVDELENVYDTVDEKEYTERVLQRQEDDWIDDDGKFQDSLLTVSRKLTMSVKENKEVMYNLIIACNLWSWNF